MHRRFDSIYDPSDALIVWKLNYNQVIGDTKSQGDMQGGTVPRNTVPRFRTRERLHPKIASHSVMEQKSASPLTSEWIFDA